MIMKKQIISWGMMLAAAFTLTNCAKEIEGPAQESETKGYPFEIVASAVDTKTVNDGMATKWVTNDKINLFHVEAGGTADYQNDNAFTVADVDAGRFTGELSVALEPEKKYDWYAIYPYSSNIITPGERTAGYTFIGHKNGLNQSEYNSTAALAGTICPFYGVAKAVDANTTPSIEMKHLTSVVAINVTNTTDTPVTIKTASLTATEDIVGSYYIDITGASVAYNPREGYVDKTATVNVSGGTALAKGESAILYLAIKPFVAKAGSKLVLSVNGDCEKELVMPKDITFAAGKIKTLNFNYDAVVEPEPEQPEGLKTVTISFANTSQRTSYSNEKQVWENDGVVFTNSKGSSTSNVGDYSNPARFYKSSDITITAPGNITSLRFDCTLGDNLETKHVTPLLDISEAKKDGDFVVIPLDGMSNTFTHSTLSAQARANSVTVVYVSDTGETPEPDPDPTPVLTVDPSEIEVEAVGGDKEITYTVTNPVDEGVVTATTDVDWISDFDYTVASKVTFSVKENTTAIARTATITLSYAGAESKTVNVNQAAKVEVDDSFEPGQYWIIQSEASLAMKPLTGNYGYPGANLAQIVEGSYKSFAANIFVIEYVAEDKCYAIKDSNGKYLYMKLENDSNWYKSFNVSADYVSDPKYQWAISANDEGKHIITNLASQSKIAYSAQHSSWGAYADISSYALPTLVKVTDPLAVELDSINVTGQTTSFTEGEEFKFGGTVTANYNDGSTKDVTANVSVTTPDMVDGAEVTVSYTDGNVTKTVTYKITVKADSQGGGDSDEPVVIFYESFDNQNKTGGNDGNFASSGSDKISITGWTLEYAYAAKQCIKLGGSSNLGSATTPSLGQAGNMTLTFKAAAWNNNKEKTTMKVSISGGGTLSSTTVNISKTKWTDVTIDITGATASSQIKFEGAQKSNGRFFLDEVKVVEN